MKPLELSKPHLLIVVGLPGAGKSFFAKQFSETFGAPYVDYNHYQQLIKDQETGDIVATELLGQLFLTRRTIIVEGRGETKQDRQLLAKLAKHEGYELLYIWVQTEPQTVLRRAVKAKDAPYSESEFEARSSAFTYPERALPQVVISGKHTYASQAKMVLRRLAAPRVTAPAPRPTAGRPMPVAGERGSRNGRIIVG